MVAIGAVDIAIWDVLGKAAGLAFRSMRPILDKLKACQGPPTGSKQRVLLQAC